jgi:hypothetical protein
MNYLGGLIGHFSIKNENDEHLFKVYFYEGGIAFDFKLTKGIMENKKTKKEFIKIDNFWLKEKDKDETIKLIMKLLDENQEYLSNFFDLEHTSSPLETLKDTNSLFFEHLKNNKLLKEISKKQFESNIIKEEIGDFYVENLEEAKSKGKFYTYKSNNNDLDFYLLVIDEKIKLGFTNN